MNNQKRLHVKDFKKKPCKIPSLELKWGQEEYSHDTILIYTQDSTVQVETSRSKLDQILHPMTLENIMVEPMPNKDVDSL